MSPGRSFLLIITPALQLWLAVLLVRRGVHRRFKYFFIYTLFAVCAELLKLAVRNHPWRLFYVAWTTEAIYVVLGYLAIYEVFTIVFRDFYHLWWFRYLLPLVSILMVGPAIAWAVVTPIQGERLLAIILSLEIVVRCLQAGIFLLIFGLARFFNMYWRQYAFGIAAGFFVSTFGLVASILVRSGFGTKYGTLLNYGPPITYIIAVLIWIASFLTPQADPFGDMRHLFTPELFVKQLQDYKRSIKELFKPWFSRVYSFCGWR